VPLEDVSGHSPDLHCQSSYAIGLTTEHSRRGGVRRTVA